MTKKIKPLDASGNARGRVLRICAECAYCAMDEFGGICTSEESENYAEYINPGDACEQWKEAE